MKTRRLKLSLAVGAFLALAFGYGQAVAQNYPSTLRVPVTFYDFHSDRTNPEFEVPHGKDGSDDQVRTGMVAATLDADGKPKIGNRPYLNHGVRFWFRDNARLSQYKAASEKDPRYTDRGYLEKFRPVYMYGSNYPLTYRQQENANGYSEWSANPTTGLNQVPYAYPNSDFRTNYTGGDQITTGAAGFTMNNRYYAIDSAFKNVVIPDTLTFNHRGQGIYNFVREGTNQFYPLGDGNNIRHRGLTPADNWIYSGGSGSNRNYSYTMELVWDFRYDPTTNNEFNFMGDDDVWVFIGPKGKPAESKLVMDLGGIHEPRGGNFNLDQLVRNGTLNFSENDHLTMYMFYCERHANDANISITTGIITSPPTELFLDVTGEDLIAGVPKPVTGIVYDIDGKRVTDFSNGTFNWNATDVTDGGPFNRPSVAQKNANGTQPATGDIRIWSNKGASTAINKADSIWLVAYKAYTRIRLDGEYCENGVCVPKSITLTVRPNNASKLFIEASADSLTSLRDSNPIFPRGYIDMASTDASTENFYAILRDAYGNWVRPAAHNVGGSANAWVTNRPTVATATNGTRTQRGQGRADRVLTVADTTGVRVTHTASNLFSLPTASSPGGTAVASLTASSVIRLLDINYVGIRIGVKVNGVFTMVPSDTIHMYIPSDSTIWVQQQRSDNGQWVEAPANWSAVAVSGPVPGAIPSGTSYTYSPTAPGTIRLIARTLTGSSADTLTIVAKYNRPVAMRFFSTGAEPTSLSDTIARFPQDSAKLLYPVPTATVNVVTVQAGVTMPIFAGTFATNPPALTSYIPPNTLPGSFVWHVLNNPDANATKITPSTLGYAADFRSTRAHETYVVRAAYVDGGDTLVRQELRIQVIPGAIAAVYIEPVSQDLERSSLNKPLTFTGKTPILDADGAILRVEDTLYMTKIETSRTAYALLRDKWGNYIAPSGGYNPYWDTYVPEATTWGSDKPNVVTATAGNPSMGQGFVSKDTSAADGAIVSAKDNTFVIPQGGNPAFLPVKIRNYGYTDLRIVEKNDDGKKYIDDDGTLKITTNDEPNLVVQGKRSDCNDDGTNPGGPTGEACWEDVPGTWGPDEGLANSLQPPPPGSSWKLDPRKRGDGKITVTIRGADGDPIYAELPTEIKLGPPLRAELVVITPAEQIKAGQPIQAEVRYYNRTGLMEEWDPDWNSPNDRADFTDNKGVGKAKDYPPTVTSKGGKKNLGIDGVLNGHNARLGPNIATGRDTVIFYLYNAGDNPHGITYAEEIEGKKLDAYVEITLLPGDAVKVVIVDGDGNDVGEKIEIEHEDDIILVTEGEDEYGNRTGKETSTWCIPKDANIPQSNAKCEGSSPAIVYETGEAEKNGCGTLTATPTTPGINGDRVEICIVNVSLKPLYAITRDDGDGYLDAVEVFFAASFSQSAMKNFDAKKIYLHNNGSEIKCKDVKIDSNVVTLILDEARSGELQTGWTPTLEIKADLIENVRFSNQPVRDGAAPVIRTAKKYFDKNGDKTKDYIEVTFSEKVRFTDGPFETNVAALYAPDSLFKIWERDNSLAKVRTKKLSKSAAADPNRYDPVPDALFGIREVKVKSEGGSDVVFFFLENGFDLGPPNHYINIAVDNSKSVRSTIRDNQTPANLPDVSNRKVPITFGNEPNNNLVPVPNPASPDKTPVGNSEQARNPATGQPVKKGDSHKYIGAYDNPGAVPHIRAGGGGAVFQVPVYIPNDVKNGDANGIKCQVKVYDLAGNLVSSGAENNILNVTGSRLTSADNSTYSKMDLFWSGFNSKGMKAAPGTYRIIVQISYPGSKDPKAKNQKYTGTVGIAK